MFDIIFTKNITNIHLNNRRLYNKVNRIKRSIDNIPNNKWYFIRSIISKYEVVGNRKILHDIDILNNHN